MHVKIKKGNMISIYPAIAAAANTHVYIDTISVSFLFYRVDIGVPVVENRVGNIDLTNKQTSTDTHLLDEHLAIITTPTPFWFIPLAVLTIGLKFSDELSHYFDLLWGLMQQLYESVGRKDINI